ncbi:hypothetical protein ACTZWT_11090 [Rhodopseudomonas sp. NSM]|uniref:hypothetical protein n=1 Tax=Rhodopseudomonas sp. NSM TaxID=3457630 RepID=UPI004035394E
MKNHRLSIPDDEHRVLPFRPRRTGPTADVGKLPPVQNDLAAYERGRDELQDDFRHRMLTNIAALAFTAALTVVGFWLATSIADLRRTQDCVLMGRRDCAQIAIPQG